MTASEERPPNISLFCDECEEVEVFVPYRRDGTYRYRSYCHNCFLRKKRRQRARRRARRKGINLAPTSGKSLIDEIEGYIRDNEPVPIARIAEHVGLAPSTVRQRLCTVEERGLMLWQDFQDRVGIYRTLDL
jgi:hypothetical protein